MIRAALAAATLSFAALTACAAPATSSAPTLDVPKATEAPPTPTIASAQPANLSPRGNVPKKLGEVAAFGPTQDQLVVKFAIDKITVDPKCTSQFAGRPLNGHFIRLDVRAETDPSMAANTFYSINPFEFATVGADGITESSLMTGAAITCVDTSALLPSGSFSPGSKYRGALILDTRNPSGVLVFRPGFMGTSGGWEWEYGK